MKPANCLKPCSFWKRSVFFLLIAFAPVTGFVTRVNAAEQFPASHRSDKPPLISITIENMTIQQAASLLEKKTNYHIKLQSINPEIRVSGHFVKTDMEIVCTNLLRGYNLLVVIDTKQRLMTVESLGSKMRNGKSDRSVNDGVQVGFSDQGQDAGTLSLGNDAEIVQRNQRDPFTGMAYADIIALHQKQVAELAESQQADENVEPFTGMTYAEIQALHKEQTRALSETER